MKRFTVTLCICCVLLEAGCSVLVPKEMRYLSSVRGHATQADVQLQWGRPKIAVATPVNETIWVYNIYEIEPGSQSTWSSSGSWCDEYVLTFDQVGVLQKWTRKGQRHGGELMPTYCVQDGFAETR